MVVSFVSLEVGMFKLNYSHKSIFLVLLLTLASWPMLVHAADPQAYKVVYHMDDARAGRFALHIAKDQLQTNPKLKIAIVAYGAGVDFLLKGATDRDDEYYAPAVQELLGQGVQFKVCAATLRFRDIPKSQVLEGMKFVPAGTYEVIRLQAEEGYVYLKP